MKKCKVCHSLCSTLHCSKCGAYKIVTKAGGTFWINVNGTVMIRANGVVDAVTK